MMGTNYDEQPVVPTDVGSQGLTQAEMFANEVRCSKSAIVQVHSNHSVGVRGITCS